MGYKKQNNAQIFVSPYRPCSILKVTFGWLLFFIESSKFFTYTLTFNPRLNPAVKTLHDVWFICIFALVATPVKVKK
jgi:hypothetical protein